MLIDANIFIEVLLEQEKAEKCKEILKKVASGQIKAVISLFTIDSIIIILERSKVGIEKIKLFINSLYNYNGLKIYAPTITDRIRALEYIGAGLDYEDSLVLQCALSNNTNEILSMNKDFDKIRKINRIKI